MYEIVLMNIAIEDIRKIIAYIKMDLHAPAAAEKLLDEINHALEQLTEFPYSFKVHQTIRKLSTEYRKLPVENYLIFYSVDEKNKKVKISRVIYAKRDLTNMLS